MPVSIHSSCNATLLIESNHKHAESQMLSGEQNPNNYVSSEWLKSMPKRIHPTDNPSIKNYSNAN